jgi:hypothetical protein
MIIIDQNNEYHQRHLYQSASPSSSLKNLSPITFPSISPSLPYRSWENGEHGCFISKEFVFYIIFIVGAVFIGTSNYSIVLNTSVFADPDWIWSKKSNKINNEN